MIAPADSSPAAGTHQAAGRQAHRRGDETSSAPRRTPRRPRHGASRARAEPRSGEDAAADRRAARSPRARSPRATFTGGSGRRRSLLFERPDGHVWPVDPVEVEHHELRVLELVLVRLTAGAGDRLDPERGFDLAWRSRCRRPGWCSSPGRRCWPSRRRPGSGCGSSRPGGMSGSVMCVPWSDCGQRLLENAVGVRDHVLRDARRLEPERRRD